MNSILYLDEYENHFESYYYNVINSPQAKKARDNIGKEEFYEAEENFKENKDISCYIYIEKTTKEFSKDNVRDSQKEEEEKKSINKDDNFLFTIKEEKEEKKEEKREKNGIKQRKKCGRKRLRNDDNQNEHNKYSDDNLRRKIKHLILKNILKFLNLQIKSIYNEDIGNGIFRKELQTINQSQKSDATINFNIQFLTKQLSEIFSDNISGRFTNLPPNHNKSLIKQLLNEKDEEKRNYFRKLFGLKVIDCLKHFRGEEHIEILDGLVHFKDMEDEILSKYEEDGKDYYETLKYYLDNYERIIYKKKARKSRKKEEE